MTVADTRTAIYAETDWIALFRRLETYARALARGLPPIFDGVSADDLVGEALSDFFASADALNWDPAQGTLERFLCGVVKNKYLGHARRHHISESVEERRARLNTLPLITGPSAVPTVVRIDEIRCAARGDKQLEELVDVAQGLETVDQSNQQLSEALGTTVEEVINRKRRLKRRLHRENRVAEGGGSLSE
jgi:DNA-directed RNA polymerase specialized sigma24 family protein